MIEREESGQAPDKQVGGPGTYLKGENEDTDVDASEVEDESDGMPERDFLGKSNLRNRDKDSEENA
ncbi:hypothetical protein FAES_4122 [Fibrella aestuarina BUZ 2]|uniref:Uncharacterized protein n=1 Tax=Fibrella aestuarina BUZ 2 TaxID=1166018 RepID=I0KDB9_9BACT|nr:hypothetical protein [Fibrella aestuarina]CCH02122.1 hypothetical protein FAES_4122 [Fibrella aestuarina BUZ 2]